MKDSMSKNYSITFSFQNWLLTNYSFLAIEFFAARLVSSVDIWIPFSVEDNVWMRFEVFLCKLTKNYVKPNSKTISI